ncbi:unnamed protein product [Heligmosomoides polygyrus]|uniref:7TM_GPCR_Srx domain-containing protein n=1 Tax=Heligmosomoides polygyrus TaxID=6339 RepID=A0A183FYT2_HELPZ|nr:unnamed protein product [Heligmosomoides polygyrus]
MMNYCIVLDELSTRLIYGFIGQSFSEMAMAFFTCSTEGPLFTLTVVLAFCAWQGVIGLTLERKALKAAKQSMRQLLND